MKAESPSISHPSSLASNRSPIVCNTKFRNAHVFLQKKDSLSEHETCYYRLNRVSINLCGKLLISNVLEYEHVCGKLLY